MLAFAGNPIDALWVLPAYGAIQQVESNLLTPLVMRQAASLHPAIVIAVVTVAGVLVAELWFERLEKEDEAPRGKPAN